MYECLHPPCPSYARTGVQLEAHELRIDHEGFYRCPDCGHYVRKAAHRRQNPNTAPVLVGTSGALLGGMLGGPVGALIGGVVGVLLGANSDRR